MGVDCKILLPAGVRIDDVATVIGACAGLAKSKYHFSSGEGREVWSCRVKDVKVESFGEDAYLVACARITWANDHKAKPNGYVMYHFEGDSRGRRLLSPRSTAWWITVGRRLVGFFGGIVDYNDCDAKDADYRRPPRKNLAPEDGKPWRDFQEALYAVKPITEAEVAKCKRYANYD